MDGGRGWTRTIINEGLNLAAVPFRYTPLVWSARSDSNRDCSRFEGDASYQLGYARVVGPGRLELPKLPGLSRQGVPFPYKATVPFTSQDHKSLPC